VLLRLHGPGPSSCGFGSVSSSLESGNLGVCGVWETMLTPLLKHLAEPNGAPWHPTGAAGTVCHGGGQQMDVVLTGFADGSESWCHVHNIRAGRWHGKQSQETSRASWQRGCPRWPKGGAHI
jgi:hypothetical protein